MQGRLWEGFQRPDLDGASTFHWLELIHVGAADLLGDVQLVCPDGADEHTALCLSHSDSS